MQSVDVSTIRDGLLSLLVELCFIGRNLGPYPALSLTFPVGSERFKLQLRKPLILLHEKDFLTKIENI